MGNHGGGQDDASAVSQMNDTSTPRPASKLGKLKAEETVADGLENAPEVINRLFDGSHRGKLLLKVASDM